MEESCMLIPSVEFTKDGKKIKMPSDLYKNMYKSLGENRVLTNYYYAKTLASTNIDSYMASKGVEKTYQGEYPWYAVREFLGVKDNTNLQILEKELKANGILPDESESNNFNAVMKKVIAFNRNPDYDGVFAFVTFNQGLYNVVLRDRFIGRKDDSTGNYERSSKKYILKYENKKRQFDIFKDRIKDEFGVDIIKLFETNRESSRLFNFLLEKYEYNPASGYPGLNERLADCFSYDFSSKDTFDPTNPYSIKLPQLSFVLSLHRKNPDNLTEDNLGFEYLQAFATNFFNDAGYRIGDIITEYQVLDASGEPLKNEDGEIIQLNNPVILAQLLLGKIKLQIGGVETNFIDYAESNPLVDPAGNEFHLLGNMGAVDYIGRIQYKSIDNPTLETVLGGIATKEFLDSINSITPEDSIDTETDAIYEKEIELFEKHPLINETTKKLSKEMITVTDVIERYISVLDAQIYKAEREGDDAYANKLRSNKKNVERAYSDETQLHKAIIDTVNFISSEVQDKIDELKMLKEQERNYDNCVKLAKLCNDINVLLEAYQDIINKFKSGELVYDKSIDCFKIPNFKETLIESSNEVNNNIVTLRETVSGLKVEIEYEFLKEPLGGDTLTDGNGGVIGLMDFIASRTTEEVDMLDTLFQPQTSSNTHIALMATVVRDQQVKRDEEILGFNQKLREATTKLYKSGVRNTRFMYDDYGMFVSEYDFAKFEAAKEAYKESIKNLPKEERAAKIIDWENANTEPRIVDELTDPSNPRIEMVPRHDLYPNNNFQKGWNDAQKEYYKYIMELKGVLNTMIPNTYRSLYNPPQIKQKLIDALVSGKPIKDILYDIWKGIKNSFIINEDDGDYGFRGLQKNFGDRVQVADINGKPFKHIPVTGIYRLKDQSLLCKDCTTAMQALISSCVNYKYMSEIHDRIIFMSDFIKDLEVDAKDRKGKKIVQNIRSIFPMKKQLTEGKSQKNIDYINDYIDREFYGERDKSTSFLARVLKNLISFFSFKSLAPNLKGAVSNLLVGNQQLLINSTATSIYKLFNNLDVKDEFNYDFSELMKALGHVCGTKSEPVGALISVLSGNKTNINNLLYEYFDPSGEGGVRLGSAAHYDKAWKNLMANPNEISMIGYGGGEHILSSINMFAVLEHVKVLNKKGEIVSLINAFDVTDIVDGNRRLKIKDGFKTLDGDPIELNSDYLRKIKSGIRGVHHQLNGAMCAEDKGIAHQKILFRLILNFRQWMVEFMRTRYGGYHWNGNLHKFEEGRYRSMGGWFTSPECRNMIKDLNEESTFRDYMKIVFEYGKILSFFKVNGSINWKNMSVSQRIGVCKAASEIAMLIMLSLVNSLFGDLDDDDTIFQRFWLYQLKRTKLETEAAIMPLGLSSLLSICKSPIPSLNVVTAILYPFENRGKWDEVYTRDKYHKGENKMKVHMLRELMPGYKDFYEDFYLERWLDKKKFDMFENPSR